MFIVLKLVLSECDYVSVHMAYTIFCYEEEKKHYLTMCYDGCQFINYQCEMVDIMPCLSTKFSLWRITWLEYA